MVDPTPENALRRIDAALARIEAVMARGPASDASAPNSSAPNSSAPNSSAPNSSAKELAELKARHSALRLACASALAQIDTLIAQDRRGRA